MTKEYTDPGPIAFRAVIQRNEAIHNSSAYIAFPHDLKETYGVGNLVPFKARFDGTVVYKGSLAKMGGPDAMILMTLEVREQLRKGPGDEVDVVVELDDKPRPLVVPGDILQALRQAGQLDYFLSLAYSHRKEYVKWVDDAKQDQARRRRIQEMCQLLADNQTSA